jgi:polar amino acid transport system substrate-binding protein
MTKVLFFMTVCTFTIPLNSVASELQKQPLTILSGQWAPYVGEALPSYGFISQIVTAAFEAVEQPISYKWLPWPRGKALIKRGRYFASFPYAKTDIRQQNFLFSDAVFYVRTDFFYYKAHNAKVDFKQLSDIKHLRIGGVRGYGYVKRLQKAGLDLYLVNNAKQLIEMLERDRIDLIAVNHSAGWDIIKRLHTNNAAQFDTLDKPVNNTHGVHLLISKDYPNAIAMRKQFNKGLEIIISNGVFQQIIEQLMPKGFSNQ